MIAFLRRWLRPDDYTERDKALLVSFLAAYGDEASVLTIICKMRDYTRGEHDWQDLGRSYVYRLLRELESDGSIVRGKDIINNIVYSVPNPSRLMEVM